MLDNVVRAYRKYRSSGIRNTFAAVYEEVYRKQFLNPYIAGLAWKQSDLSVGTRFDLLGTSKSSTVPKVRVPKKAWIGTRNFSELEEYAVRSPEVYSIKDCVMFSPNGLTVTSNGEIVADTISPPELLENRRTVAISKLIFKNGIGWTLREFKKDNIKTRTNKQDHDIEQACPVMPLWINYYHWTIDCLPRLRGIEDWYQQTGDVTTVLIPPDPPSWMTESLDLLAGESYETQEFVDTSYAIEKLIVPTYPYPSPESCQWLREKSTADMDHSRSNNNRIYVSREQANRRRVANRNEVDDVLSQFGFKSYVLEEMSIREQIRLFTNAEAVVSPHGAGLANIVYADDPVVIELFGTQKKTTFYRLAKILDQKYHYVCGKDRLADIRIDPAELRATLSKVLT